jgi:hypothetical protein
VVNILFISVATYKLLELTGQKSIPALCERSKKTNNCTTSEKVFPHRRIAPDTREQLSQVDDHVPEATREAAHKLSTSFDVERFTYGSDAHRVAIGLGRLCLRFVSDLVREISKRSSV